ncbi:MAG: DUF58 domain-containing protein [Ruminococcus sp.]
MWYAKLLYLLLTGIVYLFSMLYLPEFSVYLLISMLLLPLGFFAAAHNTGRKLKIQLTVPAAPMHPGEACSCTVLLQNPTCLPIGTVRLVLQGDNMVLGDGEAWEFQTAVPAKGTAQLTVSVEPEHCGEIRLALMGFRVYDMLHLFSHRNTAVQSQSFLVLPFVVPLPAEEIHTPAISGQAAQMQPTTEPEEFLGVRNYRNGDRMRAIHWKLSSRFPEPVVREYGIPVRTPVVLGFHYALSPQLTAPGDRLDAMLEALTAFVEIVCSGGDSVTLLLCCEDQCRRYVLSAPEELIPILRSLLASPPGTDSSACWDTLEQTGEQISFCIADSITIPPENMTIFAADAASAGNGAWAISPQSAAKTVYHVLTGSLM